MISTTSAPSTDSAPSHYGITTPRLWTKPLRELTPETTLGYEVIDFARVILGVMLYPWQQWLLIHALELLPDGQYRFKRVIVLVARQQGKTTLASVLAAWWLYMDSARHPDRVPPVKFKVVGIAQNLDIAREPWKAVKLWSDPTPDTLEEADLALPSLQDATAKVVDAHGKEAIIARSRAHYEIRAARNARGKPAARVLMDEMREQKSWDAWNAVSQTTKAFWAGQLWGVSSAGDVTAIVLRTLRDKALELLGLWEQYVDSGIQTIEDYANGHDTTLGIFEWSAPEGCAKDDVAGILQANPSIGYGAMTVASALADINALDDAGYRTEVLCQWVTSRVTPFLDAGRWSELVDEDSAIADDERIVLGVCVKGDRSSSSVAAAGLRLDGLAHLELLARRESNLWVVDYLVEVRDETGINEVALQSRGVPSAELVGPLEDIGFVVHRIEGTPLINVAGRTRDLINRGRVRHLGQPPVSLAVANGTTKTLSGGMPVWDIFDAPVDVAPIAAMSIALYALDTIDAPEVPDIPPPPPQAEGVARLDHDTSDEANLATVGF